jgi:hypothetical protein
LHIAEVRLVTIKQPLGWFRPGALELNEGDYLRHVRSAIRATTR